MANAAIGSKIVYIPVIKGMPAILVYPITSGIASAANVIPAVISKGICVELRGNNP
jgi:hypothetical protein